MAESDLERLESLRRQGILSEDAYWDARSRLYTPPPAGAPVIGSGVPTGPGPEPVWQDESAYRPAAPATRPRPRPGPQPGPQQAGQPVPMGRSRPANRGLWWLLAAFVTVAVVVTAVLTLVTFSGSSQVKIKDDLTLVDDATAGASCQGQGDDAAIRTGAPVRLRVGDRTKSLSTTLLAGKVVNGDCVFAFEFGSVEPGATEYAFDVAGQVKKSFAKKDLASQSWHAAVYFGPPKTVVNGSLELDDADTAAANCITDLGYDDITEGASVTVKDQDGRILGSGFLGAGTSYDDDECTFDFTIPDVRTDQEQYSVEVTHRGQITKSRTEMEDDHWMFSLTLGN